MPLNKETETKSRGMNQTILAIVKKNDLVSYTILARGFLNTFYAIVSFFGVGGWIVKWFRPLVIPVAFVALKKILLHLPNMYTNIYLFISS